jgi:putative sporulation protein YtaF
VVGPKASVIGHPLVTALRNCSATSLKEVNAMQDLLYTFLIALTNNFDNIGARVAYSIQGTKISTLINLWISVITFVISFLAAVSGTIMSGALGKRFSSITAMVFLVAIGSWMILDPYLKSRREVNSSGDKPKTIGGILLNPENADLDNSKHIDFKEATFLGIALSINNVGGGVSAGMLGLNSFLVGFLSAVLSFVALWAGNYAAEFFIRRNIANKAAFAGGVILIAIGIEQLF